MLNINHVTILLVEHEEIIECIAHLYTHHYHFGIVPLNTRHVILFPPIIKAAHRLSITYEEYKKMLEMYTIVNNEQENTIDLDDNTALRVWDNREEYSTHVEEAACRWMKENRIAWQSWEPKGGNGKVPLVIGGIFPITGSYTARGILVGKCPHK